MDEIKTWAEEKESPEMKVRTEKYKRQILNRLLKGELSLEEAKRMILMSEPIKTISCPSCVWQCEEKGIDMDERIRLLELRDSGELPDFPKDHVVTKEGERGRACVVFKSSCDCESVRFSRRWPGLHTDFIRKNPQWFSQDIINKIQNYNK